MIGAALRRNSPWMIGEAGNIPQTVDPKSAAPFGQSPVTATGMTPRRDWREGLGQIGAMLLASGGNPLGRFLLQQRAQQQENELERERYERRQADEQAQWVARQQWERTNPAEAPIIRDLRAAGIDPASPQGQQMLRTYAQNRVNPIQGVRVTNPDGSEGIQFIRPGDMGGAAGGDDEWDYGGPTPQASGTFPPGGQW